VKALKHLQGRYRRAELLLQGKRIAVITFTNKACAEIERRLEFDPCHPGHDNSQLRLGC